jgi:hypothetical protein
VLTASKLASALGRSTSCAVSISTVFFTMNGVISVVFAVFVIVDATT